MPRHPVIRKVKSGIEDCIKVDFDRKKNRRRLDMVEVYGLLAIMEINPVWIRQDKTTHGLHLIIKPDRVLSYHEVLIVQGVLGDDPFRQAYNFKRIRHCVWLNQLFETSCH